jgi:hypothetical protein
VPGDLEWRREAYPDVKPTTELRIHYLGIWDTVGALGIPKHLKFLAWLNGHHQFHDTNLSSFVERARHALAADERRRSFEPGVWTNLDDLNEPHKDAMPYEQLIFPGVHSAVGGGGPVRGLSDIALDWIFHGAREQGLAFDLDEQSPIFTLRPDHRAQLFNAVGKTKWSIKDFLVGVGLGDRKFPDFDRRALHVSMARRYGEAPASLPEGKAYRPRSLKTLWGALEEMAEAALADKSGAARKLAAAGDERALQTPKSVKAYIIQPGDTLQSIAQSQMGSKDDAAILAVHNRNVGLLFEDGALYAGSSLEVPAYDPPKETASAEPPPNQS